MARTASTITPEELRERLNAKGYVRQVDMAVALRVSQPSLSEWLTGKTSIPAVVEVAVDGLPRFRATNAAVAAWHQPVKISKRSR